MADKTLKRMIVAGFLIIVLFRFIYDTLPQVYMLAQAETRAYISFFLSVFLYIALEEKVITKLI